MHLKYIVSIGILLSKPYMYISENDVLRYINMDRMGGKENSYLGVAESTRDLFSNSPIAPNGPGASGGWGDWASPKASRGAINC